MKSVELNTIKQEATPGFAELAQEEKNGLLRSFLEQHPRIGLNTRRLALVLMAITSALAPSEDSAYAQEDMRAMREYSEAFLDDPEFIETGINLQLPEGVAPKFSLTYDVEVLNNYSEVLEQNKEGGLEDSAENIFVTTGTVSYTIAKDGSYYTRYRMGTTVGEVEAGVEPTGETLQLSALGKTRELAIGAALQNASEIITYNITAKDRSYLESDTQSEASTATESVFGQVANMTSSAYIGKYEIIVEGYNEDAGDYSVTLKVMPGILIDSN